MHKFFVWGIRQQYQKRLRTSKSAANGSDVCDGRTANVLFLHVNPARHVMPREVGARAIGAAFIILLAALSEYRLSDLAKVF
jgi:hypothetical protein